MKWPLVSIATDRQSTVVCVERAGNNTDVAAIVLHTLKGYGAHCTLSTLLFVSVGGPC